MQKLLARIEGVAGSDTSPGGLSKIFQAHPGKDRRMEPTDTGTSLVLLRQASAAALLGSY